MLKIGLFDQKTWLSIASLFTVSFALHLLPFFLFGPHPLGYDTGFYRRYLIEPFISFPNTAVPGLGNDALVPRFLLDLLRLIHLPTDIILYGSYLAFFALLPIFLFLYVRPRLGTRGALIAATLFILSPVSYNAFWYMLLKNAFALDLMLLAFIALEQRALLIALCLDVAIALSHTTTAIIYLATLALLCALLSGQRREIFLHGCVTLLPFALVNISLVHTASLALPSALFMEWPQYLWLSLPLLAVIAWGWRGIRIEKIPPTLVAFAIASAAFPLLHMPFYQRIFVFTDLALVVLSAYAAEYLIAHIDVHEMKWHMYLSGTVLCIAAGFVLGNLYQQVRSLQPFLPPSAIREIAGVGQVLPENAYVLTSTNEAPWYEGWTNAHVIAPGLLHDTHNLEAWQSLWDATSTDAQIRFLRSFPQPLYISTTGDVRDIIGSPAACLHLVAPNLLLDEC